MTGVLYVIDQLGLWLQHAQQQLEQQARQIAELAAALAKPTGAGLDQSPIQSPEE